MVTTPISQTKKPSPLQQQLIDGLNQFPNHWALTPVYGDKRPYRKNWQSETPISSYLIVRDIKNGKAKGYGLRTGIVSGGIIAIDADGRAAHEKILELSSGVPLPETVAFTSNKPGRCQYLFYVPQKYWEAIATKKFGTGIKGDDGKEQKLELRWDGCQSVLPPSVHPETGCYRWRKSPQEVALAPAPMWVIEAMLAEPNHHQPDRCPTGYTAKLQSGEDWTEEEWALSYLEALGSYRADDYESWVSVGMALQSVGDSLLTEWENWSRQSSKYKPGDCEKKWKSFKSSGEVTIGTLAHMAKQDGWQSPFNKSTGRSFGGGIGSGGGNRRGNGGSGGSGGDGGDGGDGSGGKRTSIDSLTIEQIRERIDELITQGASGSHLTGQLNRLATESKFYVGELRKLYYERLDETDLEGVRDENRDEVETLLNLTDQCLDIADYLPPSLAQPISQWCNWLNIRPAVALTALLAGISSVHKTGTELVLQRNQNFRVPSTIYAALVSPSGQKKSPIFHNMIRHSLNTLEKEKFAVYEAAMEKYETEMQQWQRTKEGKKPQEPTEPVYYFTNATGEAIPVQAKKDPSKTLLALIDELAGYFNSNNAYRNGRGSDKQDLLSYFDGSGQTILRASGVRVNLKNIYLSIFGTIQPDVLKRHMEDCSDPDGNWARFLFVNQPLEAATLHDDDGMAVQLSDRLTDFYRRIDQLPEMEYRLSRQAFKRYQGVYDQLERLRVTHSKSGMAAVYSKMEGYIGRLALNLHVLWELDAGKSCPAEEIPLFIMEMAIQLSNFYVGQVKLMHANADDESLPTHIVKLIELSKRLEANGKDGWVKARVYCDQFDSKKRPSAQQAREWMNETVRLQYGRTRGTGNRQEYHWFCDNDSSDNSPTTPGDLGNLGKVEEELGKSVPQAVSIENKGVKSNLGNLGKGSPNSSSSQTNGYTPDQSEEESQKGGGVVPEPSPSPPQDSSDVDTVANTDLGNNLGNSFPNSSPTSPSENPPTSAHTATPVVADWQVGEVVTVETDIPSLKDLDGHQGTIEAVREVSAQCLVKFVSDQQQVLYVPWSSLRRIQVAVTPCPPSSKIGSRIQCGEFIGTLAARNGNGWFVNWETSALLRKKIGEPPAVVKDGEFKLIN